MASKSDGIAEEERPNVILVEGKYDKRIIDAILSSTKPTYQVNVKPIGGKNALKGNLPATVKGLRLHGLTRAVIGIILDNDDNPAGTESSIVDNARRAGLEIPDEPGVLGDGPFRAAHWTVPRPKENGSIEEVILESTDDEVRQLAEAHVAEVKERGKLKATSEAKAVLQIYSATQTERPRLDDKEGRPPVSDGIRQNCYDLTKGRLKELTEFVNMIGNTDAEQETTPASKGNETKRRSPE